MHAASSAQSLEETEAAPSRHSRSTWGRVALAILGIVWSGFALRDLARVRAAEHWPTAPGSVRSISVTGQAPVQNMTRYGRTYTTWIPGSAIVSYQFAVRGDTWTGWRRNVTQPSADAFHFRPRAWFGEPTSISDARQLEPGAPVLVHYRPDDPRDAALDVRTPIATWVELAFGLGFLALALRPRSAVDVSDQVTGEQRAPAT